MVTYTTLFRVKVYGDYVIGYVCQDIVDYYFSLIPKYFYPKRTLHPAHVTILRQSKESFVSSIKKYDGFLGILQYNPYVHFDGLYFYLDATSLDIKLIRKTCGLTEFRDGFDSYHITIGNIKCQ